MKSLFLIILAKNCNAYIKCNDYYDISNLNDPIWCSLEENTSANRVKYTELPHELVIYDDDNVELIYTMDWNDDQSRWELSTAALLSLASRALKSVEYNAEVRTSEGLDLVKTRFKIVGTQPFSEHYSDVEWSTHNALITLLDFVQLGSNTSSMGNSNIDWNIGDIDCSTAKYFYNGIYLGFKYQNDIVWYEQKDSKTIKKIAFLPSGNGLILYSDEMIIFRFGDEESVYKYNQTETTDIDQASIISLGTVTNCLNPSEEYFYLSEEKMIHRLKINDESHDSEESEIYSVESLAFNDTIVSSDRTKIGEIIVMTKNETEICLNTVSLQFDVETNCFDDELVSQATEIAIFGEYGTMTVVYGTSGAYYSYNSGCSWKQLIDNEVLYVTYIESNDFILLILDEPTENLKMFAPGNEIKNFVVDGLPDTLPNKMWFWDDQLEYIGEENKIERATPNLACSRYIEYDGPTIFQLDRNARKELNFTVHNGAGYETALGTLSRNGDRITHRELPKLTELGELDYSLVISEFVSNQAGDENVPTILTFYLIDRDVGCPRQSLTFVLEVTCPEKKLLFDYGKSTYNAPLQHIEPENYELMGYYQGLNSKFETLNKTKTELADLIDKLQINVDESKTSEMKKISDEIEDKISAIHEEIKKLSRYNSRLIPSTFQDNKASKLVGRKNHINIMGRSSNAANTEITALQMIQAGQGVRTSLEEVIQANPLFGENAAAFQTACHSNSNGNCAFYEISTNYRPPSVFGKSIPINDRLYNADLNLDLTAGLIVQFVASKWDEIKKNAKNWWFNENTGNWNKNCHQNVTLDGKTEEFTFSQFDTNFDRAECLRYVMHTKQSPAGFTCVKVATKLTKGEYIAQPGVVVKMEELNGRNETHEYIVIENNVGIPQSLNHACDPVILLDTDKTIQDIQDVKDIPEAYSAKLSEREFDLNDIYIVSLKSGLFHFRVTVSNLSFCDLTLDFAYHVEEYSQLDSRRSIIITAIVLVFAMSVLMTDFTRYYTSIKPELANIKNKMVLVHEDSEFQVSDESLSFRNGGSGPGNKMKVKLLMNNNTVEVDTPTMDMDEESYDDDFDEEESQKPRKTLMNMIRRRTQHQRPSIMLGRISSVDDPDNNGKSMVDYF